MRRLRAFLVDELILAQAVPGFLLCVGWTVMYEIYHEDGSFYTTLMQEILGADGLFPYFLVSAVLMAFPVGLVMDTVREVVVERWLSTSRRRAECALEPSSLHAMLQPFLRLDSPDDRYAVYRYARSALLTPAKAAGNLALVILTLLAWFAVKIVRMGGWHVFSWAFIMGTLAIGAAIVVVLFVRYTAGAAEYHRLIRDLTATTGAGVSVTPVENAPPPLS